MSGFAVRPAVVDQVAAHLEGVATTVDGLGRAVRSAPLPPTGRPSTDAQLRCLLTGLEADLDGLGAAVAEEAHGLRRGSARYRSTEQSVVQVVR